MRLTSRAALWCSIGLLLSGCALRGSPPFLVPRPPFGTLQGVLRQDSTGIRLVGTEREPGVVVLRQDRPVALERDLKLRKGDRIRTDAATYAVMRFREGY